MFTAKASIDYQRAVTVRRKRTLTGTMKAYRSGLLFLLRCSTLVLMSVPPVHVFAAQEANIPISDAWQAVQTGRAVVIMRHARAPGVGDPSIFDLNDCDTQRNLSEDGREQAVAIGDVLRGHGIPKAQVLSSQWCRCMDTASLLDLGEPQPVAMLNSFFENRQEASGQTRMLRDSLQTWLSGEKTSRVLVTHQVNITALTGNYASSGEMLIVTLRDGEPAVLASIPTD